MFPVASDKPLRQSAIHQTMTTHRQSSGLLKGEEASVKTGGTDYCVLLNCGAEDAEIVTSTFRIRNKRTTTTIVSLLPINGRSQWPHSLRRASSGARLLGLRVRIPPGAWMSVSNECCELSGTEVSAAGWSLVRRSPTGCGVSVIVKPRLWKGWPTRVCCAMGGGNYQ
jgi:hypothetical protein